MQASSILLLFPAIIGLIFNIIIAILSHFLSYLIPKKTKPLKGWSAHNQIVSEISSQFKKKFNDKNNTKYLSIKNKKSSVCGRSANYKTDCDNIDVSSLDSIIAINNDNNTYTAWIESNCKMGEITDILLSYGYILKVTPELENVSIGGAVQGLGVETTSYKYGMIHHIVKSIEIILPNGNIKKINRDIIDENDEYNGLFQCISGSFNTIALVTAVQIELIPNINKNTLVEMDYIFFDNKYKFMDDMTKLCTKTLYTKKYDFVEGLRLRDFNDKGYVLCLGKILSISQSKKINRNKIFNMSQWYTLYWFAHICEIFRRRINHDKKEYKEYMYIRDYLFRHDRGVFWNTPGKIDPIGYKKFGIKHISEKFWFRFIFGGLTSCTKMMIFKKLRGKSDELNAYYRHTHDYAIPLSKTITFLNYTEKDGYFDNNTLIWFCPLKINMNNTQYLFAPHHKNNNKEDILMDIGIYGYIPQKLLNNKNRTWYDTVNMFINFDRKCCSLGGTKAYYSSCFLSEKEFWTHFDKNKYDFWRNKLNSNKMFPNIYDKVGIMGKKYSNVKKSDPLPFKLNTNKISWLQLIHILNEMVKL